MCSRCPQPALAREPPALPTNNMAVDDRGRCERRDVARETVRPLQAQVRHLLGAQPCALRRLITRVVGCRTPAVPGLVRDAAASVTLRSAQNAAGRRPPVSCAARCRDTSATASRSSRFIAPSRSPSIAPASRAPRTMRSAGSCCNVERCRYALVRPARGRARNARCALDAPTAAQVARRLGHLRPSAPELALAEIPHSSRRQRCRSRRSRLRRRPRREGSGGTR